MKKPALKPYVQLKKVGRTKRPYFRLTWRENGKRREKFIPLPLDMDSPEFDTAYWSIRAGTSTAVKPPEKDTWADLIREYRTHPKYITLAASTRRSYDRIIEDILENNGHKAVRSMTRAHVRAIQRKYSKTPRKADWYLQVLSLLLNFAIKSIDWDIENIVAGMDHFGKQRQFLPWPDWLIEKLDTAPPVVRTTAELILGTGQRPNAAIEMRRDHFSGNWMQVLDEKADARITVYAPRGLLSYIDTLPITGTHLLPRNQTQALGYSAVEKTFRAWRATLGPEARRYSLHGLRKLAIIRLAEAHCTDAEIQAITNQSLATIQYYREMANRKTLSKSAMELLDQANQNR